MHLYDIQSSQKAIHPRLKDQVLKHKRTPYLRPIPMLQLEIFKSFYEIIKTVSAPLILDAGCGTGMSTFALAKQYPDHFIVGVDQSAHRLNKAISCGEAPKNLLWLQADLVDFWRLCLRNKIIFEKQLLLYPNPYPKPGDLSKRFHGHPVFLDMLSISKELEVRSNWKLYLEEFQMAVFLMSHKRGQIRDYTCEFPMTLFERKYIENQVPIYQFSVSF